MTENNQLVLDTTHAWISLTRLCGCNYKTLVEYRGKSVYVKSPQIDKTYRINAEKFKAGEPQFRDSWCIEAWGAKAERTAESEQNWQT